MKITSIFVKFALLLLCVGLVFPESAIGAKPKLLKRTTIKTPDFRLVIPMNIKEISKHVSALTVSCHILPISGGNANVVKASSTVAMKNGSYKGNIAVNMFLKQGQHVQNYKGYVCSVHVIERNVKKQIEIRPGGQASSSNFFAIKQGSPFMEFRGIKYLSYESNL